MVKFVIIPSGDLPEVEAEKRAYVGSTPSKMLDRDPIEATTECVVQ
jgi:hypothetical protein